ncbi:hypothetical protein Rhe02_00150 [Rhizocola hellebori]|uniref:Uncharacterized protein n=1 Tax=Rhizocola hellebori TaxID=1392758 RepID=A0A8J3VD43_9ACTN|nr:hypothetical protein Rhe02_00150 [Rhizocola hellebori]
MALLIAVSTTVAGLGLPTQALANVECRYSIASPPPLMLPNVTYKRDDIGPANPLRLSLEVAKPKWSAIAVKGGPGVDYDLALGRCEDEPLVTSTQSGAAVDFVAVDGNAAWTAPPGTSRTLYATVTRAGSVTGQFALEYSTGGLPLRVGFPESLNLRDTPAVVRDVYVASGTTAVITLRLTAGDADLAVVDSLGAAPNTAARSRSQSIAQSNNPGLTPETVAITVGSAEPGRTFGVVVVNNAASGNYTLARS